jgi:cellulose biosynthesis protein BcsQ
MAKIICFGNQKGGSGKTTATCLVANALASSPFSRRVFVCDCDPQQSIIRRRLADQRTTDQIPPYQVAFKSLAELQRDVIALDKSNDFIFLDLPGKLDSSQPDDQHTIAKFLQYVDVLVIPFTPGNYSLESTLDYLRAALKIRQARSGTPRPLDVVGFINMAERTLDDKYLLDEIADLRAVVNIQFLETRLQRYALFRNVDTLTSFYQPGTADKAKANLTAFLDELLKITGK